MSKSDGDSSNYRVVVQRRASNGDWETVDLLENILPGDERKRFVLDLTDLSPSEYDALSQAQKDRTDLRNDTSNHKLVVARRKPDGEWKVVRQLDDWEITRIVLTLANIGQEEFDALSPDDQFAFMEAIVAGPPLSLTPPPETVH